MTNLTANYKLCIDSTDFIKVRNQTANKDVYMDQITPTKKPNDARNMEIY